MPDSNSEMGLNEPDKENLHETGPDYFAYYGHEEHLNKAFGIKIAPGPQPVRGFTIEVSNEEDPADRTIKLPSGLLKESFASGSETTDAGKEELLRSVTQDLVTDLAHISSNLIALKILQRKLGETEN